jgi:NADH-quinone oxidoreductase subunit L
MTVPLVVLAVGAVGLGFLGTPAWPWLQSYLGAGHLGPGEGETGGALWIMALSAGVAAAGIGLGWRVYGWRAITDAQAPDPLRLIFPAGFDLLHRKCLVDEIYAATVLRWHAAGAWLGEMLDRWLWGGAVLALHYGAIGLAWVGRWIDEFGWNLGFDRGCRQLTANGRAAAGLTDGRLPNYLRGIATAFVCLLLLLVWGGCR